MEPISCSRRAFRDSVDFTLHEYEGWDANMVLGGIDLHKREGCISNVKVGRGNNHRERKGFSANAIATYAGLRERSVCMCVCLSRLRCTLMPGVFKCWNSGFDLIFTIFRPKPQEEPIFGGLSTPTLKVSIFS